MTDMERALRDMMQGTADAVHHLPQADRGLVRRARLRRVRTAAFTGAAAVALVIGGFTGARSLSSDEPLPPALPDSKESAFEDSWVTTDIDGSNQMMVVRATGEDAYEIVVRDDSAGVCSGAPSTMTGAGGLDDAGGLVIPSPAFTCDDGSEPKTVDGIPVNEVLRNLTFVHDPEADTLADNLGLVWDRSGTTESSGGMWPQSSLEEVRRAQRLADAGDARYTWQVLPEWPPYSGGNPALEPSDAEIFTRFLQEKLGWEEFSWGVGPGRYPPEDWPWQFIVVRCAPGQTNPMYPNDPDGRGCAPTIDESRYETVMINADAPVRDATNEVRDDGIWVVTRWTMLQPSDMPITSIDDFHRRQVQQVAPPSDDEADAFTRDFLQARVNGEGAEEYAHTAADAPIPLLYTTSSGARYDRFELEAVRGPVWPSGWVEYEVRLFADDGTVVEQPFLLDRRADGRLVLLYRTLEDRDVPTLVNGEILEDSYEILDGEVTFAAAAPPWRFADWAGSGPAMSTLLYELDFEGIRVMADPVPAGTGCEEGRAPADAEALAESIRSDPDIESSEPVSVRISGIEALQMDVAPARGASICDSGNEPLLFSGEGPSCCSDRPSVSLWHRHQYRLYLLDVPGSGRILAVQIFGFDEDFERLVESAAPILDSFEFNAP